MRMIQIRNVPDRLHRRLKARAALAGMTLSDYLRIEIERILERPTRAELAQRIAERDPVELEPPAAEIVREERERR
jgi:plasmid stability protein